jgi:hypothetical protein
MWRKLLYVGFNLPCVHHVFLLTFILARQPLVGFIRKQNNNCSSEKQAISPSAANEKYTRDRMRMRQVAWQKRNPDPLWVAIVKKEPPLPPQREAGTTKFFASLQRVLSPRPRAKNLSMIT